MTVVSPKIILQRPGVRSFKSKQFENKVYQLFRQFAELSLFVERQLEKSGPAAATNDDFYYSYCGKKGHRASECPQNRQRNSRCAN